MSSLLVFYFRSHDHTLQIRPGVFVSYVEIPIPYILTRNYCLFVTNKLRWKNAQQKGCYVIIGNEITSSSHIFMLISRIKSFIAFFLCLNIQFFTDPYLTTPAILNKTVKTIKCLSLHMETLWFEDCIDQVIFQSKSFCWLFMAKVRLLFLFGT